MPPFRVLSLDGGGSWALIQVKALMALFGSNAGGHQVLGHFDLSTANSGGSIVLGCLIENFTLQQILDFFCDETRRRSVFSEDGLLNRALNKTLGIGPKYSSAKKLPALQRAFPTRGNKLLADAVRDIPGAAGGVLHALIVSFDYDRNRSAFFRSKDIVGPSWGVSHEAKVTLAEAVHASTNAPVNYFDAPAVCPNQPFRYWDGGVSGCNNPVLAGVTEAIGLGASPNNIVALSIGTGNNALPWPQPGDPPSAYTQSPASTGLMNDVRKLATAILDDPPDAASFVAHVMTGCGAGVNPAVSKSSIVRMNPLVAPVPSPAGAKDPWSPPGDLGEAGFKFLAKLDMDAVDQDQVMAICHFADLWVKDEVRNQCVRMDSDNLHCDLGQDRFSAAVGVWKQISGDGVGVPPFPVPACPTA